MVDLTVTLFDEAGCDLGVWNLEVKDPDNITAELIQLFRDEHITIAQGDRIEIDE